MISPSCRSSALIVLPKLRFGESKVFRGEAKLFLPFPNLFDALAHFDDLDLHVADICSLARVVFAQLFDLFHLSIDLVGETLRLILELSDFV